MIETLQRQIDNCPACDGLITEEDIKAGRPVFFERFGARDRAPDVVARTILKAIDAPRPRLEYVVGFEARLALMLPFIGPARLLDWCVARVVRHFG